MKIMNKYKFFLIIISSGIILSSCSDEKSFEIIEPYSNHQSLFGLKNNVKSVTYEKQIFEITDGGYYPVDTNTNDIMASLNYPYSMDGLKYMGRLNDALIFNYPITGNQYLLNELILAEISGENVKIEFENNKIIKYSNTQRKKYSSAPKNHPYSITCEYDEKGRLISLDIKSYEYKTRKINFQYKGSFLTQIIEHKKESAETINFVIEKINDFELNINRNGKEILVFLNENLSTKELRKIVYTDDNNTIIINNNKVAEAYKIKSDGKYDRYEKLTYEDGLLKTILKTSSNKKNTVTYDLNSNSNIESISVATDEKRMSNLGLKFNYAYNNKGDWTEMSYARDRKVYDNAKRNVQYVKEQLLEYGYSELQAIFSKEYNDAGLNMNYAKQYSSKTTFKRNIVYSN